MKSPWEDRQSREWNGLTFGFVDAIEPCRDELGALLEFTHQIPSGIRPNRYAAGPFCHFRLHDPPRQAGVYAITVSDRLVYIGECENLRDRFSSSGYGKIARRNCHHDGQSTNCKLNARILGQAKAGQRIDLWFLRCEKRKRIEAELITALRPEWNGRQGSHREPAERIRPLRVARSLREARETSRAFHDALDRLFAAALASGQSTARVHAGELHRQVGGYPSANHRMPVCCAVIKRRMGEADAVLVSPPKGAGANLTIEYRLPRLSAVQSS
jgi:hypothetical protein